MQEPNFHVLYLELMEKMNKPMMDKHLATTTYKYIRILLRSDRIKTHVRALCMNKRHVPQSRSSCMDLRCVGKVRVTQAATFF